MYSANQKNKQSALIVVDQQLDFEPGGALAVSGGDQVVPGIVELMNWYQTIVLTQDFHPAGHISFASSHAGKKPYDLLTLEEVESPNFRSQFDRELLKTYLRQTHNGAQVLWPDHCVQGSHGANFDPHIPVDLATLILRKGNRKDCDSYSAFKENDGTPTGLAGWLKDRGIRKVVLVGLAGDYCVYYSAKNAIEYGFQVHFEERLTRFVNFPANSKAKAMEELRNIGCQFAA